MTLFMNFRSVIKKVIYQIPILRRILNERKTYKTFYPPGHYANPFPSLEEFLLHKDKTGINNGAFAGIDLNLNEQLELFKSVKGLFPSFLKTRYNQRYSPDNPMFGYLDGLFLYSLIRYFNPRRIIEVGSGYSSALMLDTQKEHNLNIAFDFIEPYPARLNNLLSEVDKKQVTIHEKFVQDIPVSLFNKLEKNDILFLDTSHIAKSGSDLIYELFKVLPALKSGVIVHIHDIMFPFEYPEKWIQEQKGYNEIYFVRSFLMHNQAYKVLLWPSYLYSEYFSEFSEFKIHNTGAICGSIYIQKN